MLKVLVIGDIVGRPGRNAVKEYLQKNGDEYDFIIANGENAAGGRGITPQIVYDFFNYGVDVITLGNHVWDKKEIIEFIEHEPNLIRPANYPPPTPGKGAVIVKLASGVKIGVINLSGRIFLPSLDCPFRKAKKLIKELKKETSLIIIDFHAEATSEKVALGWFLDGQVSGVLGTHTHIQTADERILPGGTAYISDIGMTGPRNSVLGMKKEAIIERFLTQMPIRFEVAGGETIFNAVSLNLEIQSGKCTKIKRIKEYFSA
ncbi:MAG TPA: TIGR00282 family metallophosphoesterase [Clostridia bacterium]|nr:TIGR00282 family metallophosphoesterase [Clostridia bacterium]